MKLENRKLNGLEVLKKQSIYGPFTTSAQVKQILSLEPDGKEKNV